MFVLIPSAEIPPGSTVGQVLPILLIEFDCFPEFGCFPEDVCVPEYNFVIGHLLSGDVLLTCLREFCFLEAAFVELNFASALS